ncbi:hypothetical protein B7P43_G13214 [Cryptotermes secundus]|uniref:Cyclin-like domain-containing protein n=1 Tax=Cryptotermes secundus TaxID=105785 RepID=A0A2J7REY7_9NEOP|nr:cyclin-L1 [Cryptotermes secundus]PNF39399.1 hypothetical protein B7P43_G13214 [Cryptotermes secundus]
MIQDQNYIALKTEVMKAELRVLKELGFCDYVKHTHSIILEYLQILGFGKHENMVQLAWNYLNDSLRTDVFVRYQPETIACACIHLTMREENFLFPEALDWFSDFGVSKEDVQDVCFRIVRLNKRPAPNVDELDRRVKELRRQYQEDQEARMKARGGSGCGAGGTGAQSGNKRPNGGSNSPTSPHSRSRHSSPTRCSTIIHHNSGSPRWGGGSTSRNNHASDKHRSRRRSRTVSHSPPPKRSKKSKKILIKITIEVIRKKRKVKKVFMVKV